MSIELNHTIVNVSDKHAGAAFLAGILGVPVGAETGPFVPVVLSNSVTLDYVDADVVHRQHYAFRLGDEEFDAAFGRIQAAGSTYWADPFRRHPGEINHEHGGRGAYFEDPDGHLMELLTADGTDGTG